ncbi:MULTISPECIES: hypothetical protein [unclassified Haladaptatus]|uniref:hypothetical protein n=1 Tax=unclassified Haladaptatus TaxID=2622732 RepID=UPI0023E7A20F|nr:MULTISPECIES: hypothetical protein [unclassified Haladaptatus]
MAVVLLYLITAPIWLTLAPTFVGLIIYLNAGGWADALTSLPGINSGGGIQSGIAGFAYTFAFWYLLYVFYTLF